MNPTPTNLPPSVAALALDAEASRKVWNDIPTSGLRDDIARDNFIEASFKLIDACLACSVAADPAPVADEAAIEKWRSDAQQMAWDGVRATSDTAIFRVTRMEIDEAVRLMRAAPRNDDKLRKLREEMMAAWMACIENKKQFPVGSGDRRECQAEANAFQSVCFGIDKLLAESPAGDAGESEARGLLKEAMGAFEPWVRGPGVVGGILHLQEEVGNLRARLQAAEAERDALAKERDEAREGAAYTLVGKLAAMTKERDAAIRDRQDAEELQSKLAADLAAAQKERDVAKAEAECHSKNHDTMLDEVERLRRDLAAVKTDRDAFREELDAHIEARQNCKHILVGESAVQAVERLAKERDWERHEWPKQIAAALHTEVGRIGATPSMVATAVQLEHEAHTRCLDRLVKAQSDLAAAQKELDEASKIAVTANAEAVRYMRERDAAKAESARAVVEELLDVQDYFGTKAVNARNAAKRPTPEDKRVGNGYDVQARIWDAAIGNIEHRIHKLRAAQPPQPQPATVRQGDEVLREVVTMPFAELIAEEDAKRYYRMVTLCLKELARRALEGKP